MGLELPILRTSERRSFKTCPQQWWWAYRMGYNPKMVQADALWFGIGIHFALACWYQKGRKRGPHPAETFASWIGDEISFAKTYLDEKFDEPIWEDARELGIAMLDGYIEHYGRDENWDIISVEQPFKIQITRARKPIAYFASRWDGVFRDKKDGLIYLLEHKTAAQINLAYLEGDDQAGAYWAVASTILRKWDILKPGEEIAGIQYNFLRKAKPDSRPQNEIGERLNKDGSVSKKQPPPLFVRPEPLERSPKEQKTQLERIADEVTIMQMIRRGEIPVVKNRTRDCPRCLFWVACLLHDRGGDSWQEVMRADFQQMNPYADIRKSAGE